MIDVNKKMPSETIKQCFRRHQHLRGFAIFTKTVSQNPVIPAKTKNQKTVGVGWAEAHLHPTLHPTLRIRPTPKK
ncbi:hypothetical protein NX88_01065 [Neisseria meningitidis]|nr:hypothetical protein NX88_01065 [Neisseria meningitidis]